MVLDQSYGDRSIPGWSAATNHHGPGTSSQWLQAGTLIGSKPDDSTTENLRHYNARLRSTDETLYRGLRDLRGTAEKLDAAESVRERAAYLFRQAVSDGLLQGRSLEAFTAAALFVALREVGHPMTFGWLQANTLATESEVSRAYRLLLSSLDVQVLPPEPREFLPSVASKVDIPPEIEIAAGDILAKARSAGLSTGKHPAGFAGAALYAAMRQHGKDTSQEVVADAADVSVVTISRRWRDIDDELDVT